MYQKYHTQAFILTAKPRKEADTWVSLYTAELGRVEAAVKSSRTLRSKHRYHLQPFSLAFVSLVRGRQVWRVVHTQDGNNPTLSWTGEKTDIWMRVITLVERLVAGQEVSDARLFSILQQFHAKLPASPNPKSLELLVVTQILRELGYLSVDIEEIDSLDTSSYDSEILELVSDNRKKLLNHVNKALTASQL